VTSLPPPLLSRYVEVATGREASDLFELAGAGARLDRAAVSELVAFGYLGGRRTMLRGVERRVEGWDLPEPSRRPDQLTPDARADRLWALLLDAVARACVGRFAPRTTLSGGLDSRVVAAALAQLAPSGRSAGTFGDPDCADIPVASAVAAALGLTQEVTPFEPEVALRHEERVWRATDGTGGPSCSPGASTDEGWAERCDVLLSGSAGDVVWGCSRRPGPSPDRRLRRLGLPLAAPTWDDGLPPAPRWASPAGRDAWSNLWTRQATGTWNGARSRLLITPVVPIPWDGPLLSFCLGLGEEDRRDRSLLRRALDRNAPAVSTDRIPLGPRTPVHDLDRAFARSPAWGLEFDRWLADRAAIDRVGVRHREVARLVRRARSGRKPGRAGTISRLRALTRWAGLLAG
jgi:hypothetical protein